MKGYRGQPLRLVAAIAAAAAAAGRSSIIPGSLQLAVCLLLCGATSINMFICCLVRGTYDIIQYHIKYIPGTWYRYKANKVRRFRFAIRGMV